MDNRTNPLRRKGALWDSFSAVGAEAMTTFPWELKAIFGGLALLIGVCDMQFPGQAVSPGALVFVGGLLLVTGLSERRASTQGEQPAEELHGPLKAPLSERIPTIEAKPEKSEARSRSEAEGKRLADLVASSVRSIHKADFILDNPRAPKDVIERVSALRAVAVDQLRLRLRDLPLERKQEL